MKKIKKLNKTEEQRFFNKVNYTEGCWEWDGHKTKQGYGCFSINSKQYLAHRVSYTIFKGNIPKNMFICHHCDNPKCVNPFHLFYGNPFDNMRDMVEKGRHYSKSKTHCVRGHKLEGKNLMTTKKDRRICLLCRKIWNNENKNRHA